MPPASRASSTLVALALSAVTLAGASAGERVHVYAPMPTANAVAVLVAEDGGLDLRFSAAERHEVGTRAPQEVILHPSGDFAYVVHGADDEASGAVSVHQIERRTGRLTYRTIVMRAEAGGAGPLAVALDAEGTRAWVADPALRLLRTFDVDERDGTWRERHTPMPTGEGPCQVLEDPGGRFLYVLNREGCSVSRYRLDERNRPELCGEDVLFNGSLPVEACLDPSGARFYVTLETWDLVLAMSVDPRDGGLRTINAAATGARPSGLALAAGRGRLYVAERDDDSVSAFDLDPETGRLGPRLGPFPAQTAPQSVAATEDGRTLWVTGGDDTLTGFTLDGTRAVEPLARRRLPAQANALCGLAGEVSGDVVPLTVRSADERTLVVSAEAASPEVTRRLRALAAPQRITLPDPVDALAVDPGGTWIAALSRRPGKLRLVPLSQAGVVGPPSPALELGAAIAAAAAHPSGELLAVATRTPPALHLIVVARGKGTLTRHHEMPLASAPDALTFDSTGRTLWVSQPGAERVLSVALDEAHYFAAARPTALEGRPGPLAASPDGDVLYVGLEDRAQVLPCERGAEPLQLAPRTALAAGSAGRPTAIVVMGRGLGLEVETLDTMGRAGRTRLTIHPLTGALQLEPEAPLWERPYGVREASAPAADRSSGRAPALDARLFLLVPRIGASPVARTAEPTARLTGARE